MTTEQTTEEIDLVGGHLAANRSELALLQREVSSLREEVQRLRALNLKQDQKITSILEISNALRATRTEDEQLNLIMERISLLMDAERSTLFLMDTDSNELWTKITQGNRTIEIRLALGQGIAGWVGETGQSINIKDAYLDPRFNDEIDNRTGYTTRSILCQPMRNQDRRIIGVIQVLNKQHGYFSVDDELLLSAIASQAAIVIDNSSLYHTLLENNYELNEIREALEHKISEQDMLFEVQRSIVKAVSLEDLIGSLAEKTLDLIPSEACGVTLEEEAGLLLYLYRSSSKIPDEERLIATRRCWSEGPSALATREGRPYLCNDEARCSTDNVIRQYGIDYRTVIAVPLYADDEIYGTIELINKRGVSSNGKRALYSDTDLKFLTLLAAQVAPAIAANLFRARTEKADRLASIGQLISSVIHDFKTPVTIISGYVQLMQRQDDPQLRQEYAQSILKQFDQLNQMIQEVLAFARGERTIFLTKVFLNRFMEDVEELLTQEFQGRNIDLEVITNYRRNAKFDEGKLKRAIFNLARNAKEAMPNGGSFKVVVDKDDDFLLFKFVDTGAGVPEHIRESLFESFVTHGKNNGTGLGLAIVKKVVEEHNGQVSYESKTDKGTTFQIRIPLEP